MNNVKKIGIVLIILVIIVFIGIFFRDNIIAIIDNLLVWVQGLFGINASKAWTIAGKNTDVGNYGTTIN